MRGIHKKASHVPHRHRFAKFLLKPYKFFEYLQESLIPLRETLEILTSNKCSPELSIRIVRVYLNRCILPTPLGNFFCLWGNLQEIPDLDLSYRNLAIAFSQIPDTVLEADLKCLVHFGLNILRILQRF